MGVAKPEARVQRGKRRRTILEVQRAEDRVDRRNPASHQVCGGAQSDLWWMLTAQRGISSGIEYFWLVGRPEGGVVLVYAGVLFVKDPEIA